MESAFGTNTDVGVGFSDTALLVVAVAGFVFLATSVYSIVLLRLKTKEELEKDEAAEGSNYEEQLQKADVSTLSRAQRRARARTIMKQHRRVGVPETPPAGEAQDDDEAANLVPQLSRKERQRVAKNVEKEERRLFEEERRQKQQEALEEAKKEKRERERMELRKAEEDRKQQQLDRERKEKEDLEKWRTFLSTSTRTLSVDDWIDEIQNSRIISLQGLADSFCVPVKMVTSRINQLIQEHRVAGVLEKDHFVYVSESELQALASAVTARGSLSRAELADVCEEVLDIKDKVKKVT